MHFAITNSANMILKGEIIGLSNPDKVQSFNIPIWGLVLDHRKVMLELLENTKLPQESLLYS